MADKYLLRVTAGPSYDPSTHQLVNVNTPHPTCISSAHCKAAISVRIQNYRGLPPNSPPTSPYFSHAPHTHDQYSISFSLLLPSHTSIPGPSLLFGNDFSHPIRDRIPPGFSTAFRIVKWAIDPGLEGDVYADEPYLYGVAGGSWNVLRVGGMVSEGEKNEGDEGSGNEGSKELLRGMQEGEEGLEEGGEGAGEDVRKENGMPDGAAERKKWFLKEGGNFALKLPGFSLGLTGYFGGNDYLRYVLKNKDTGDVLFVVVFTLLKKDEMEKKEVQAAEKTQQVAGEKGEEAKKEGESMKERAFEGGGDDDVD